MALHNNETKVLHVITDLSSGGAQRMLCRLATLPSGSGIRGMRHEVVSLTDLGVYGATLNAQGIKVRSLQIRSVADVPQAILELRRDILSTRPDVIQSWLYHADFVALVTAAIARCKVPVVWNVRCSDMDLTRYAWTTRILMKTLAKLSRSPRAVIANSYAGRDWHARAGYKPQRWRVIPNGFDTDAIAPDAQVRAHARAELGLDESHFVYACSARLDPMKDHGTLLQAFAQLRQRYPNARLLLIGKGTDTFNGALARLADQPDLASAVLQLGEHNSDHNEILQAADALVLSSAFGEGFPNVIGEAMCLEIPCVATDCGDAARIIDDTGWTVPRCNAEAFARAMTELAEIASARRLALGAAARARVIENYSLKQVTAQYAEFYDTL